MQGINTMQINIEHIPAVIWGNKSDQVYLFVHGKFSNKAEAEDFARMAGKKGYQVISFDLPGHGDRKEENYACHVKDAVHDLRIIGHYVMQNWSKIYLMAASLGAYFSLISYQELPIERCLFLSPLLNMERLIQNMMLWFQVGEEELKEKKEILTPMGETLIWDYYCYVREHPIQFWNKKTAILYGSQDHLTEYSVVEDFVRRFGCELTVVEGAQHNFQSKEYTDFADRWLEENI